MEDIVLIIEILDVVTCKFLHDSRKLLREKIETSETLHSVTFSGKASKTQKMQ